MLDLFKDFTAAYRRLHGPPTPHMYIGQDGKIKAGYDVMCDRREALVESQWIMRRTREPATILAVIADWNRVHRHAVRTHDHRFFASRTQCDMTTNEIDLRLLRRYLHVEDMLRAVYPKFDVYPHGVRLALILLTFEPGWCPVLVISSPSEIRHAIVTEDWQRVADLCNSGSWACPVDVKEAQGLLYIAAHEANIRSQRHATTPRQKEKQVG